MSMEIERLKEIEDAFNDAVQGAFADAVHDLAGRGVLVGAVVRNRDGGQYEISRIECHIYAGSGIISVMGRKFLQSGELGTHEHNLARPSWMLGDRL